MNVQVEGENWAIDFQYASQPQSERKSAKKKKLKQITRARLLNYGPNKPSKDALPIKIYIGVAVRHTDDAYDKCYGRNEAFKRAMTSLEGDRWRELRTALWYLYHTTVKSIKSDNGWIRMLTIEEQDTQNKIKSLEKAANKKAEDERKFNKALSDHHAYMDESEKYAMSPEGQAAQDREFGIKAEEVSADAKGDISGADRSGDSPTPSGLETEADVMEASQDATFHPVDYVEPPLHILETFDVLPPETPVG